jgi:hypothetical protein
MSAKEIIDAILKFLEILTSWPVILLFVIIVLRRQLPGIIAELSKRITEGPFGLKFATLQEKVENITNTVGSEFATLHEKVETITTNVEEIRESLHFNPSSALTPDLQKKLEQTISSYRAHLKNFGYEPGEGRIEVSIKAGYVNAHYESLQNLIVVGELLAADPDVALREYTHHVLTKAGNHTMRDWSLVYMEIESGLADYFPCSFQNDALLGEIAAKQFGKTYTRNLDNTRKFSEITASKSAFGPQDAGEIWGGAFWEIRALLGQDSADKLLFSTWTELKPADTKSKDRASFAKKLLERAASSQGEDETKQIRTIFQRRGLKV